MNIILFLQYAVSLLGLAVVLLGLSALKQYLLALSHRLSRQAS